MGLLQLAVFWKLDGLTYVEEMGLAGCLFFTNVQSVFMHTMATVIVFQEERPVFLRE
jgi:hypothetical protein